MYQGKKFRHMPGWLQHQASRQSSSGFNLPTGHNTPVRSRTSTEVLPTFPKSMFESPSIVLKSQSFAGRLPSSLSKTTNKLDVEKSDLQQGTESIRPRFGKVPAAYNNNPNMSRVASKNSSLYHTTSLLEEADEYAEDHSSAASAHSMDIPALVPPISPDAKWKSVLSSSSGNSRSSKKSSDDSGELMMKIETLPQMNFQQTLEPVKRVGHDANFAGINNQKQRASGSNEKPDLDFKYIRQR